MPRGDGDDEDDGDAAGAGITIPGVCSCPVDAGDAVGVGITTLGACSWAVGVGDAVGVGITMPGVCLWPEGAGVMVDFLTFGRCAGVRRRIFRFGFRLAVALGFGFGLLIPGILCPSCCAVTMALKETGSKNDSTTATHKKMSLNDLYDLFMIPELWM